MTPDLALSPLDRYRQYWLDGAAPIRFPLSEAALALDQVDWDSPKTALELNNFAVMALIEAEQAIDPMLRSMQLELAIEALANGSEAGLLAPGHPLCSAHLALVHWMTGDTANAVQIAYATLIKLLQPAHQPEADLPIGLVYLPLPVSAHLAEILAAGNGYAQALKLSAEVLWRSQRIFYNESGLRLLQIAIDLMPNSALLHRQIGLGKLIHQMTEGLIHLHQAQQLEPDNAATLQALYVTYLELRQPQQANYWLQQAQTAAQRDPLAAQWQWTELDSANALFTYIPTPDRVMLSVLPSYRSIVTSVLLATGDWFEGEMEFWRSQLQSGMVVIDVGANVGVYTFSAAQQVGPMGRVLAVEPFSDCVRCLEETCRYNQLAWVSVCAGAASDRSGTAKLSLHGASELNEILPEEALDSAQSNFETITCYTLDELVNQHQLERLDWLKIDAEGHEMQVLAGAEQVLAKFAPAILYENVAAEQTSNTAVASLLESKNYALFAYQPGAQTLLPIQTISELRGNLNLIALPPNHKLLAEFQLDSPDRG